MKLPAFQFYPGDWRKDPGVQSLDFHDRGVWLEIICLMHESEDRGKLMLNGNPMPDDALARLLGLDKQILTTTLNTLLTYGVASRDEDNGALICRRMVRDEYIRKIRSEAGKQGGNPNLINQNSKQKPTTEVKQKPTPSSSSSSSSSSSEEDTPLPPKGELVELAKAIWENCPKLGRERSSKVKLLEALKKLPKKDLPTPEQATEAIASWCQSAKWSKDGGEFVEGIHLWVKAKQWENVPDPATPQRAGINRELHEELEIPIIDIND